MSLKEEIAKMEFKSERYDDLKQELNEVLEVMKTCISSMQEVVKKYGVLPEKTFSEGRRRATSAKMEQMIENQLEVLKDGKEVTIHTIAEMEDITSKNAQYVLKKLRSHPSVSERRGERNTVILYWDPQGMEVKNREEFLKEMGAEGKETTVKNE